MRLWPRRYPLTRLRLGPGDALVLHTDPSLSTAAAALMAHRLSDAFPDHTIVVMPEPMRLSVIERPDEIPGAVKAWPAPRVREL